MGKVEKIQRQIRNLSAEELKEFHTWFFAVDANGWDVQIKTHIRLGKLDALGAKALSAHSGRKTTKL